MYEPGHKGRKQDKNHATRPQLVIVGRQKLASPMNVWIECKAHHMMVDKPHHNCWQSPTNEDAVVILLVQ